MTTPMLADRRRSKAEDDFADALIRGLSQPNKSIPSRFFYDAHGSVLFEQITELPEYYLTRTEIDILTGHAPDMARFAGPRATLVEIGSGSSRKTEILLAALERPEAYVPLDIDPSALAAAAARLRARFPDLAIRPIVADFREAAELDLGRRAGNRVGFFPGSTIGNCTPDEATHLLAGLARLLGRDSRLILGIDLRKPAEDVLPAYDDAEGVTAAFNRNLLARANRDLGADFDVSAFRHVVTYDEAEGRLDMWLESTVAQEVHVRGRTFRFTAGERIHTEHSHKYDIRSFAALAGHAAWEIVDHWTDADERFAVLALMHAPSGSQG